MSHALIHGELRAAIDSSLPGILVIDTTKVVVVLLCLPGHMFGAVLMCWLLGMLLALFYELRTARY